MQSWFWNIDAKNQEYFRTELMAGRLRQGWGYSQNLDLRTLKKKLDINEILSSEESEAWKRCNVMLTYIQKGDFIAIKNVPTWEQFTIAEVVGGYDYRLEKEDYGHYLPVQIRRVFHRYSKVVPTPFMNALNREQNPIRVTYKHEQVVNNLAESHATEEEALKPEGFKEKVDGCKEHLLRQLKQFLRERLSWRETERLILELLKRDGFEVTWTAGPTERGADLLCKAQIGYGLTHQTAIQVKKHWETDDDTTGIDQLEMAIRERAAHAGILVTMAEKLGENLSKRVEEVNLKSTVKVLYGDELYSKLLELLTDQHAGIN